MSRLQKFARSQSTLIVAVVFLAFVMFLLNSSEGNNNQKVYAAAQQVCSKSNETRRELDQLYSAFETHNTITAQLFESVGKALAVNDPRVARDFTTFAVQYRAIQHEYDDIAEIDCERVIARP